MDEVMRDDITTRFLGFSNVHTTSCGTFALHPFSAHSMHAGVFLLPSRAAARIVL